MIEPSTTSQSYPVIFPTLAFGVLMPQIVALQFVAKVAGGALWAMAFDRLNRSRISVAT